MALELCFATPRKLPKARDLKGRVVVLDVAFASEAGGASFEKTTWPLIRELGDRLAAWVDHHDSSHHKRFKDDPRFILTTKAEHGACPEILTPEIVARAGVVDTIVCHGDFDGLVTAAKWLRGGTEPYPGADHDAWCIDTMLKIPSATAKRIDRAMRSRPKDHALFGIIVRHLASGLSDASLWVPIDEAAQGLAVIEAETRRLATLYVSIAPSIAIVDATTRKGPYDKTLLLLIGQEREKISVVVDHDSITFAAAFDSGIDFLKTFGISGGMPTRLSLRRSELETALVKLGAKKSDIFEALAALAS